jgi:hypothetical protein
MRVLDGANTWFLILPGHESSRSSAQLIRRWGLFRESAPGEEKASGHGQQGRSLDDTRFQTNPFCYVLYVEQWKFRCIMSSDHHEGGPRSSFVLDRHVRCFRS